MANEYEITDAIQWLVDQDLKVSPHIIQLVERYRKARRHARSQSHLLEKIRGDIKGEICEESKITGPSRLEKEVSSKLYHSWPCYIGRNVHIENAYIGPFTSIGDEAKSLTQKLENWISEQSNIQDINTRLIVACWERSSSSFSSSTSQKHCSGFGR